MPTNAEKYDFVMGHVDNSKRYKSQFIERFQEIIANFIVDPYYYEGTGIQQPYGRGRRNGYRGRGIVLKDAETHKAVMTYASRLVLTVLADGRSEYVRAEPVGWEDAPGKAPTVGRLLKYAFGLPGHFRTLVEAVIDMLLFGTAIVEVGWRYQEREQPVRSIESIGGIEVDSFTRSRVVAYDDVTLSVVDNTDFFPDPGEYRLENMAGVAKKFKMNALRATEMANAEIYDKAATDKAIKLLGSPALGTADSSVDETFREGIDQPYNADQYDEFTPMIGYEYWGEVPWDDDGSSRRVITVLNTQVVRDRPYPLADSALPFRALVINPVVGRFYGVSPAEVMRFDQDLQDAMKILLAEAVIRQVHPPIAYDEDSDLDVAQLKAWSPDAPIPIRGGPKGVGTLTYDANVFNGFALAQQNKIGMQEASGAQQILQGGGMGSKRSSATEAQLTFEQASTRPELAAVLLEKEAMPAIARSIIRRYQQFLGDSDDLRLRVGAMPEPVWIGDIMGDFDVQFVGSRLAQSRQQKLQSYDRLTAMAAALPPVAAMVPWQSFLATLIGDEMELPEVAARLGDQEIIALNLMLDQIMQQRSGSASNQTAPGSEPAGLIPAQAGGGVLGG